MTSQKNTKRIIKNTLYMYIRMGITMLVGLYSSRLILNALGVENYGIYNVVGSLIVAFTFISVPLSGATQRFLNYEMGKGDFFKLVKVFNLSFYSFVLLAGCLFIIIEITGLWYINNKMQLPVGRMNAAIWTFQFTLISFTVNLLKTPFESLVIANEEFSFYAYLGIAEALLKLLNALSLSYFSYDVLKVYAANVFLISFFIFLSFFLFCRKKFKLVGLRYPSKIWDSKLFKEMLSFSGWSLFSGVATITATQGVNILINAFFGVVTNAAMGIANQVSACINMFAVNFQKTFNPQIVKLYASENLIEMRIFVSQTSKFSYLLLFMIVCPAIFNMDFILRLWLINPPPEAKIFCSLLLIWQLLESLMAPMWTSINATGRIKKYHLVMNPIILSVILLSFASLKLGCPAYSVIIVKIIVDVVLLIVRLAFVNRMIGLSVLFYIKKTIIPISFVSFAGSGSLLLFFYFIENDIIRLILGTISFLGIFLSSTYLLCLTKEERKIVSSKISCFLCKKDC